MEAESRTIFIRRVPRTAAVALTATPGGLPDPAALDAGTDLEGQGVIDAPDAASAAPCARREGEYGTQVFMQ